MTTLPPIKPWNDFDLDRDTGYARACRTIAEILSDGEWHCRTEVINAVKSKELDLKHDTVNGLITSLHAHGDVRHHNGRIALTTRWRP
jgi:hypothetical protein